MLFPKDPITFSDDEQGVYNHFLNGRYLGSMKPFSEGEPGSLGYVVDTVDGSENFPPAGIYIKKPRWFIYAKYLPTYQLVA